uniref:efflux RND transporter permease subunit n=1 Tax=Acinetobacter baumannii TaxID=470 RepID=UPI0013D4D020
LHELGAGHYGPDPTTTKEDTEEHGWTERLRLIYASVVQVDKAIFFSVAVTVAAFIPLFTMQGVEGQIFS